MSYNFETPDARAQDNSAIHSSAAGNVPGLHLAEFSLADVRASSQASNRDKTGQCLYPSLEVDVPMKQSLQECKPLTATEQKIIEANQDGVVRVRNNGEEAGTGFVAEAGGKLIVITNYHVVDGSKKEGGIEILSTKGTSYQGRIVRADPKNDVAVIELTPSTPGKVDIQPITLSKHPPKVGDPLVVLGHPQDDTRLWTSAGKLDYFEPEEGTTKKGHGPNRATEAQLRSDKYRLHVSIHIEPGNSGSPVLNTNGEVVGIINQGNNSSSANGRPLGQIEAVISDTSGKFSPVFTSAGNLKSMWSAW